MNAATRAELDALERIVAREPVGEEHLELAALVESVQAGAPRMAPEFAQRLDARIAARTSRRRRPSRDLGRFALAGGGLVAAAVAFTVVISSGLLTGGGQAGPGAALSRLPAAARSKAPAQSQAPAHGGPSAGTGSQPGTKPFAATHGASTHGASPPSASTPSATAPPVDATTHARSVAGARLVHRTSMLELATPAASLPRVADRVVALTERDGGVISSSYVNAHGPSSRASFSLRVRSGRLAALIASLSGLAHVQSLTQDTTDVTSGYGHVRGALDARRAERTRLQRRLATAPTAAVRSSLQRRIATLNALIARDVREATALLDQARMSGLHVDVVVGGAPARRSHAAGGLLDRASRTALHALEELLAIALVALAIALPVALCALILWWGAAGVRQRARERAIGAA